MKDKLAKLIDLKSILTILVTIGLVAGWFMNKITSEEFLPIVLMVYGFYFGKKSTNE